VCRHRGLSERVNRWNAQDYLISTLTPLFSLISIRFFTLSR
jgi:hypothetical protein